MPWFQCDWHLSAQYEGHLVPEKKNKWNTVSKEHVPSMKNAILSDQYESQVGIKLHTGISAQVNLLLQKFKTMVLMGSTASAA